MHDGIKNHRRLGLSRGICSALIRGLAIALAPLQLLAPYHTAVAQTFKTNPRLVLQEHSATVEPGESPFAIGLEHVEAVPPNSWIEILSAPIALKPKPSQRGSPNVDVESLTPMLCGYCRESLHHGSDDCFTPTSHLLLSLSLPSLRHWWWSRC